MNAKLVSGIIRIAISFTLIGLLLFIMRKQLIDILELILNIKVPSFIIAIILIFIAHFFVAMRLRLFLAAQQIAINIKEAIGLTLIGVFFNNFLPTAVGGDAVKAYYASKKTKGKLHSFTSVFMDRFMGLFAIISWALLAFILLSGEAKNKIVIWPIWVLFFIAIIFLSVLFNKSMISKISAFKIFKWIEKLHSSLLAFRGKKKLFIKTFSISLIAQFISFIAVYYLIRGLHDFVPLVKILLIIPLIIMMSMLPSIGGLGIREGAFLFFFKPFIGVEKAFAVGLLWLSVYILLSVFGGFVYAFARHEGGSSSQRKGGYNDR